MDTLEPVAATTAAEKSLGDGHGNGHANANGDDHGGHGSNKPRALQLLASHRPRNVGWKQAGALLFGDWGTSRLYVLGLAFFYANRASFWLICMMSILVAGVAWAYTQICRIYPDGGGVYAAARQRSQVLAVVGALLLFADYTITVSLSVLDGFHYFGLQGPDMVGFFNVHSAALWTVVAIAGIGCMNLLGPKHTAGPALVAAIGMVIITCVITFGALPQFHAENFHQIKPLHENLSIVWVQFTSIVLALSGVEAIANLTGVLKKPVAKTAAKSIWVVAIEVCVFNILLALVMVGTNVSDDVLHAHRDDMLAFLSSYHIGHWAEICVRILGGLLLLSAGNTAIGGIIAVLYLLARDNELPQPLQFVNRFGVPYIPAMIALVIPAAVVILAQDVEKLSHLYAIGVIGAVAINVTLCATHPRLRRWYRKVPMMVLGIVLLAIWVTLAKEKGEARNFVIVVMIIGLGFRWLTKWWTRGGEKPSLLRQAIREQLSDTAMVRPKVLLGTYGSTALADQALAYCQQHHAALVVCFVRELALNEHVFTEQGRFTIDTDPVALRTFAHFLHCGHDRNVPIIPAYDTGNDATTAMAETAALYGCDKVLIGTSRRGTLHRLVKGTFQTRLEGMLPEEIKVEVVQS